MRIKEPPLCAFAAMDSGDAIRGLATPLLTSSTSYGAPAHQQVMSPTQGTPALELGTRVYSGSTLPPENAQSDVEGFEPMAAGRAFGGAGQHVSHCRIQGKHHGCRPPWRVGLGHIILRQCPARAWASGW